MTAVRSEPAAARSDGQHVGWTTIGVLAIALGLVLVPGLEAGALGRAGLVFLLVWIGSLLLLAAHHPDGILAPAGLYLIVFGLFHGGLLVTFGLRGESALLTPGAAFWIRGPEVVVATRLVVLGCLAFTGAVLFARRGADDRPIEPEAATSGRIGTLGLGLLGVGLLASISAFIAVGGLGASYGNFYAVQGSGLLIYGMLFIGLGVVFAAVGTPTQRRVAMTAFGLFALVALPLGLRGPVLFVAVVVLALEVRRGRRVRPGLVLVAAIGVLTMIGVVRETRTEGPAAILRGDWLAGPSDAVSEMGYSIYPTVVVYQWHAAGEPYRHGTTLVAVPLRYLERISGAPTPQHDHRLMNVELGERVGAIGGSPVAEGYHNFGSWGVFGLMAAIGLLIGGLDRRPRTAANSALLAVVFLPLVVQIRNSFAPVPAQVVLGLVLLGLALLVPRDGQADRARRRARG